MITRTDREFVDYKTRERFSGVGAPGGEGDPGCQGLGRAAPPLLSSVLLSSLELRDTKVYEPQIRALLGTASHFCEVVVLKLRIFSGVGAPRGEGDRFPYHVPYRFKFSIS